MKTLDAHRNVSLYKLFVLFNEPLFWGPILIPSIQKYGHMSLSDVFFMEAVVTILIVILNTPTGVLADVIGRKKTLIIGRLLLLMSTLGFSMMSSPRDAWIADIIWAIGCSFQSGSDQALIYNTLKVGMIKKSFIDIEGRAVGTKFILAAVCSLIVGVLGEIDLRIPMYMSIPFMVIPLIVTFNFKEGRVLKDFSFKKQFEILKTGIHFVIAKPEVRWIIGLFALISSASKIWFFTYNPYFSEVGISIKYTGIIFSILNLVAWQSSRNAKNIEKKLGERGCIVMMVICIGFPILIMGAFPFWPMSMFVIVQNVVRGFMKPFISNYMHERIKSEEIRATVMSASGTLSDGVSAVSQFSFGRMNNYLGLMPSLTVLGALVLILGKFSYNRYMRLFPKTSEVVVST